MCAGSSRLFIWLRLRCHFKRLLSRTLLFHSLAWWFFIFDGQRLEIVGDEGIPETAEFFVDNFWEDEVASSQVCVHACEILCGWFYVCCCCAPARLGVFELLLEVDVCRAGVRPCVFSFVGWLFVVVACVLYMS